MSEPLLSVSDINNLHDKFELYIAIDFGTDGMGIAYAYKNKVYVHDKWDTVKFGRREKPKTTILLDDKGVTRAIGMDAKQTYMAFKAQKRNEWMLFERFKMLLYEDELHDMVHCDDEKKNDDEKKDDDGHHKYKVNIKDELIATNGKRLAAEKVFVAAFQEIKTLSTTYLRRKKIRVNNDKIQWIITVPAIWNDEAKHKMKEWTIKSGLVNENISNQCRIVYEPDCGSLAVHYHKQQRDNVYYDKGRSNRRKKKNNTRNSNTESGIEIVQKSIDIKQFEAGDKYILIDAGGGTVDIACHEVFRQKDEFGVEEIYHPSGGSWGSCYIDDEYGKVLEQIFNKKRIDEFKKKSCNGYVRLIHDFQKAKETFYLDSSAETHDVELHDGFVGAMTEEIEDEMSQHALQKNEQGEIVSYGFTDWIKNAEINGIKQCVQLIESDDGISYLRIIRKIWENMFDVVLNKIIGHLREKLDEPLRESKYYCLIGGLSCSPYFKFRMNKEFGPKSDYHLIPMIPDRPLLSVVTGAAYLGITKNFVKARVLKCSYGIIGRTSISEAREDGIPEDHIKKHLYYDKIHEKHWVRGCVRTLAHKNEKIILNKPKTLSLRRINHDKNVIERIIRSNTKNGDLKTTNDGKIVGQLCVLFNDKNNSDVITEFYFDDTMLKIKAYPKGAENNKDEFEINYDID